MSYSSLVWLALVVPLVLACPAMADEKPRMGVIFILEERTYRDRFRDPEISKLEEDAAKLLAGRLRSRLGFLTFEARAGAAPAGSALKVRLNVKDPAAGGLQKEVGIHIELVDRQGRPRKVYWRFRPEEKYREPVGTADSLLKEIDLLLAEADYDGLVRDVLSNVSIASTGRLWKNPLGWVIPYRPSEVCVAPRSLLRIDSAVPSPAGILPETFTAHAATAFTPPGSPAPEDLQYRDRLFIVADPGNPQDALARLTQAPPDQTQVTAVYIVAYEPLTPCRGAIAPESVDFRPAGGRP